MTIAADAHIGLLALRTAGILARHLRFDAGFINMYELLFRNLFYFLQICHYFFGNNFPVDRLPDFPFYVAGSLVALAPSNNSTDMYFEYRRSLGQCVPVFYIFDHSES